MGQLPGPERVPPSPNQDEGVALATGVVGEGPRHHAHRTFPRWTYTGRSRRRAHPGARFLASSSMGPRSTDAPCGASHRPLSITLEGWAMAAVMCMKLTVVQGHPAPQQERGRYWQRALPILVASGMAGQLL